MSSEGRPGPEPGSGASAADPNSGAAALTDPPARTHRSAISGARSAPRPAGPTSGGATTRTSVASAFPTASPARLTQDMTVMIHRQVAAYAVFGLLPGVPQLLDQAGSVARLWLLATVGCFVLVVVGMIVQGVRARPLGRWAGAFAVLTLLATASLPFAATGGSTAQPWLYWVLGLATVCAAIWVGLRPTIVYGVALGACWTLVRLVAGGGHEPARQAISESVFAISAGLVIAVVALGMLASAAVADDLAAQLYARQLQEAVDRAVGEERARLDQLIHDDVMTTLTSAAYAGDAETGEATALLARETLQKVDALPVTGGRDGSLSLGVFGNIAEHTARRVSPDVGYTELVEPEHVALRVPMQVTETVLGALREAVRNAVRHARAGQVQVNVRAGLAGTGLVGTGLVGTGLVGTGLTGPQLQLEVQVVDDGRGFERDQVPANRFGVRVSMLEASRQAGVSADLVSRPGQGTTFTMRWVGPPDLATRQPVPPPYTDDRLPVAFPVRQFVAVTWLAFAVGVGDGLANLDQVRSLTPLVLAILCVGVATAVLLGPAATLRLSRRAAALSVGLLAAGMVAMDTTLGVDSWPDTGLWHLFPTQLLLVCLVIRRRPGFALAGLLVVEVCLAWWSLQSPFGWEWLFRAGSGHVIFVVMALLVNRVLRTIGRRQAALRQQEDEAIDDSVRRHVALVQRSLWVADLKAQTRAILVRLSEVAGPVPPVLRYDALLVEATLRESLVARNVMSDELAVLTENARRRGVDIRFVDSRHTVVPLEVSQALLDAIRRALASPTAARLVVRLAPDDGASKATVLAEDASGTRLVTLDRDGVGEAREVHSRDH